MKKVKNRYGMKKRILWIAALLLAAGSSGESSAQSGYRYPYVQDGKIIVSRDEKGGVKKVCLHPYWTATPSHSVGEDANRVAARFEVAAADADAAAWGTTDGSCTTPWRRPTQRELLLMWVMQDRLTEIAAFTDAWYWSSTNNSTDNAWRVHMGKDQGNGSVNTNALSVSYRTRCVKDIEPVMNYPKVVEGKYIVSEDEYGSSGGPFHANWTAATAPSHDENSANNAVSRVFEVAANDLGERLNWNNALFGCTAYSQPGSSAGEWRLPTQKELKLIYDKKSLLIGVGSFQEDYYWSSTENSQKPIVGAWSLQFLSTGASDSQPIKANRGCVRCVRDL